MCNCGKKSKTNGVVALAAYPTYLGVEDMDEVFRSAPINLKQSVLDASNGKKKYFIRASDARKYNGGDRYLVITSVTQQVAEPILDWLKANPYHKHDFAAAQPVAETVEPVVEVVPVFTEDVEDVIEVSIADDTLYIAAYDGNVMYEHLDADDFTEMTLDELNAYVEHYQIDIGRATAESTIRERVTEWYNDAHNG